MFKKKITFGIQHFLGGKDRSKFKNALRQQYDPCNDEAFESLFPAKEEIVITKDASNNRLAVYLCQDVPKVVEYYGDFLPTVYALWEVPHLLPCFVIEAEVSKYILKGADLMLPGVIMPQSGFEKPFVPGENWAIRVISNRFPFAVGSCVIDRDHISKNGMRGKCLELRHYFSDALWHMGPRTTPNESFTARMIYRSTDGDDAYVRMPPVVQDEAAVTIEAPLEMDALCEALDQQLTTAAQGGEAAVPVAAEGGPSEIHDAPTNEAEAEQEGKHIRLTAEEMDMYLHYALLEVLHTSIKEDNLPLEASSILSKMLNAAPHVLRSEPLLKRFEDLSMDKEVQLGLRRGELEVQLDIKRSSYKKLSKFIQFYAKEKKLLAIKENRGILSITNVHRTHRDYILYEPISAKANKTRESRTNNKGLSHSDKSETIKVLNFYTPPQKLVPVFQAAHKPTGRNHYYTLEECLEALKLYIDMAKSDLKEGQGYVAQSPSDQIQIDQTLISALFPKQGNERTKNVLKKDLYTAYAAALIGWHAVISPGVDLKIEPMKVIRGPCPPIRIFLKERDGGRKMLTHIIGLQAFHIDASAVAEYLQRKLASSASTYILPGNAKEHAVLVQGTMVDQVRETLIEKFLVPKQYVTITKK